MKNKLNACLVVVLLCSFLAIESLAHEDSDRKAVLDGSFAGAIGALLTSSSSYCNDKLNSVGLAVGGSIICFLPCLHELAKLDKGEKTKFLPKLFGICLGAGAVGLVELYSASDPVSKQFTRLSTALMLMLGDVYTNGRNTESTLSTRK